MKTKLHSLSIIALLLFSIGVYAQCSIVSGPTITPNGLMISVTGTGAGAAAPVYLYDWGDQTAFGATQTATHTYASAGTYKVCMYYADFTDTSCFASNCAPITVSATGIETSTRQQMEITAMPNPFSVSTSIQVTLSQPEKLNITVYDITGQQVATVYDGVMQSGQHSITWKPDGMAEGIYFLMIQTDDVVQARKIIYSGN